MKIFFYTTVKKHTPFLMILKDAEKKILKLFNPFVWVLKIVQIGKTLIYRIISDIYKHNTRTIIHNTDTVLIRVYVYDVPWIFSQNGTNNEF